MMFFVTPISLRKLERLVCQVGGLLKFESRVSSIKNGRIRCFLMLIQLKLETRVLILETRDSIEHKTRQVEEEFCR